VRWGRARTGIIRVIEAIGWGVTWKDRALIAAYYGMLMSQLPWLRDSVPKFWLGDVRVQTPAGRFDCRGRSTDMNIVDPHYESALLARIQEILEWPRNHPPVFVDIGAHIGKYPVLAGRILRGCGRVIAIEPDPENFGLLQRNVELNKLNNVHLFNVGCWSRDGVLSLHRAKGNLGAHSFVDEVGAECVSVNVRTIDSILSDLNITTVDLLKVDVQGAEAEVLKGASTILGNSPAVAVIFENEVRDPYTAESMRILQSHDFRITRLDTINYLAER
jgi:FkbM family methyltransferase